MVQLLALAEGFGHLLTIVIFSFKIFTIFDSFRILFVFSSPLRNFAKMHKIIFFLRLIKKNLRYIFQKKNIKKLTLLAVIFELKKAIFE